MSLYYERVIKFNDFSDNLIQENLDYIVSGNINLFLSLVQTCFKNNNNQPLSINEIWDFMKRRMDPEDTERGPAPEDFITRLMRYSENSSVKYKSKFPILTIVSYNPTKFKLINPEQESPGNTSRKRSFKDPEQSGDTISTRKRGDNLSLEVIIDGEKIPQSKVTKDIFILSVIKIARFVGFERILNDFSNFIKREKDDFENHKNTAAIFPIEYSGGFCYIDTYNNTSQKKRHLDNMLKLYNIPGSVEIVNPNSPGAEKLKETPSTTSTIEKLSFTKAAQLCLKNNNNEPMSVEEIWNQIEEIVDYTTKTPLGSLSTILLRNSENSTLKTKSKTPIFRIFSKNPNKYVLIDPNNIQETEIDDIDETDHESEIPTGTEGQYLSFWNEFTRRLSQFTKRFDGRRRARNYWYWLKTPTDQKYISYTCLIRRDRAELEVYFYSKSPTYYKLLKLRDQIEKEFGNSLEWIDSQQKKCCKIVFVKIFGQTFPENRDEVMNFFLENFPKFEMVFDKYLNNPDNIPEEPTDTKVSKFSDWTSSYPNVSPQYKYPNPTTKITSDPQKFTSYLTPIDRFLDPNRPLNNDKIKKPQIPVNNPFRQAICVLGDSGAGKSTTVSKVLKNENHIARVIIPTSSATGLLVQFSSSKSRYVPSTLGRMMMEADENPQNLYTAVFDEMHKGNIIEMINDELLQAISIHRNNEMRFISLDPDTAEPFTMTGLWNEDDNCIEIPNNFGFIFISSKPKVISNNPDFFNRVDLVIIEQSDRDNIRTANDIIDRVLPEQEKIKLRSTRND